MVRRGPFSGLLPGLGGSQLPQHRAFFCFKTALQKNCRFLTNERRENSPETTQRSPIGCALLFLDPGGLSPGGVSGWHRPCLNYFPRLSWFIQGPSVRPFDTCRFLPFEVFLGFWRPGLYNGLRIGEASNPGPPQKTLHEFSANAVMLYRVRRRPHLPACLRL